MGTDVRSSDLLTDHAIRARQNVRWNRRTDLLGGFEIYDQFELCGLFHGKISRLWAVKNFVDVPGSARTILTACLLRRKTRRNLLINHP
jgi:hypothetical protein